MCSTHSFGALSNNVNSCENDRKTMESVVWVQTFDCWSTLDVFPFTDFLLWIPLRTRPPSSSSLSVVVTRKAAEALLSPSCIRGLALRECLPQIYSAWPHLLNRRRVSGLWTGEVVSDASFTANTGGRFLLFPLSVNTPLYSACRRENRENLENRVKQTFIHQKKNKSKKNKGFWKMGFFRQYGGRTQRKTQNWWDCGAGSAVASSQLA